MSIESTAVCSICGRYGLLEFKKVKNGTLLLECDECLSQFIAVGSDIVAIDYNSREESLADATLCDIERANMLHLVRRTSP